MQESVYREKSSGTDTIEHLQLKWVEITKAVFCKKLETEFLAFTQGLLLWESGQDKKGDGTIFSLIHMQVFQLERDK